MDGRGRRSTFFGGGPEVDGFGEVVHAGGSRGPYGRSARRQLL